jgi:aspartate aminotransferase/aminotransferase
MGNDINRIADSLTRSGVRKFTDRAALSGSLGRYIRLGLGQPLEQVDPAILQAASQASLAGETQYTPNIGLLRLREKLSEKLRRVNRVDVPPDQVLVTIGATYGLALVLGSILNPGEEVLVPDPGYPNYGPLVRHYSGRPVFYTLDMGGRFCPDPADLRRLITPRTKAILVNSPGNPTGMAFPRAILREIVALAEKHGLWVVSDEVYDQFCYDDSYESALCTGHDRVVSIFSFSKTHNIPGLRVGYVVSKDAEFVQKMVNVQELYVSCAPSVSQHAAIAALDAGEGHVRWLRELYREKRDVALEALGGVVGYAPNATFFILLDVSDTGMDGDRFASKCFEEHQLIVSPGATFGPTSGRYVRLALVCDQEEILKGLRVLNHLLQTGKERVAIT